MIARSPKWRRYAAALFLIRSIVSGDVVVTTANDENNGSLDPASGSGTSLREAVLHAPDGSVIGFSPVLDGQTLILALGQIPVGKNLSISASPLAAGVTVSGNHTSRVFNVAASKTVSLTALDLIDGDVSGDGGAILNAGNLTLVGCEFSGNAAGDGGGAIENSGTLTLSACTLAGNTAQVGGGAIEHASGTLTATNCTFSGNTAGFGGAIDGDGSSTIRLYSCTVSGNHATDDGGGLEETTGTLLLENTIIAGNSAADLGPDLKASSINTQTGVNLVSSTAGLGGSFGGLIAEPNLGALADNGGLTRTLLPFPASPAIDAGGPTALTLDQRALPRVDGTAVDIGAVEVQRGIVTTTADAGPGSLRDVVAAAPAGSAVTFLPSLDGQTIGLTSPVVLVRDIVIDASDRTNLAISGGGLAGLLTVDAGVAATLRGLTLRDGNRASGGAIHNSGTLSLQHCVVRENQSGMQGGGIFNATGAQLDVLDCEIAENSAFIEGGGVFNQGVAMFSRSSVRGNSGGNEDGGSGGGILSTGSLGIFNSLVTVNSAVSYGGGIESRGTLTMERTTVSGNSATTESGGGVFVRGAGGGITDCTISGNAATGAAGGVLHTAGELTIRNSTIEGNQAVADFGGGIFSGAILHLESCTISGNGAGEDGGGIHVDSGGWLSLKNSIVAGNTGFEGEADDIRGPIQTELGVNLAGTTAGIAGGFSGLVGSPGLSPLGDHGGPTRIMLPLPGSPAIDAGGATLLATDQRGLRRVVGGGVDIGAVEVQGDFTDTQPPSRPLQLTLIAKAATSVVLSWDTSTDDVGVVGYDVFRDGNQVGSAWTGSFTANGLVQDRSYTFRVVARDGSGNASAPSNALLATPQAGGLQAPPEQVRTEFHALILNYNPLIDVDGSLVPADTHYGNRNVDVLTAQYIDLLRNASGGQMTWSVADRFDLDEWAPPDGPHSPLYDATNCLTLVSQNYHYPASYTDIVHDPRFDIVGRTNRGEIDAVWVFGAVGVDFWETSMVGPTAYPVNGGTFIDPALDRNIVVYGFGKAPHQGVGFMCENTAHMTEVIFSSRIQPAWPKTVASQTFNTLNIDNPARALVTNLLADWTHFVQAEASSWDPLLVAPGASQCGLSHYPPTSLYNYNWNTFLHEFDGAGDFKTYDGSWSSVGGEYRALSGNGVKVLAIDPVGLNDNLGPYHPPQSFSDADVELSIRATNGTTPSHAGFLFRVSHCAAGPNQVKGYYLGVSPSQDQLILAKLDLAFLPLASVPVALDANVSYRLRLEARGSRIEAFLGDSLTPLLSHVDSSYITGGFGLSTYGTEAYFDKLSIVSHVTNTSDKWYGYPDSGVPARGFSPLEWDGDAYVWDAMDGFYSWWWEHLPKNGGGHYATDLVTGQPSLLLNSWWPYAFDHNRFHVTRPFPDIVFPPEDVTPPSLPSGLMAIGLNSSKLAISWNPATDDVGVTRYAIYRDGEFLRKTSRLHLTDTRLSPGASHTYEIMACDGSGNESAAAAVVGTTPGSDSPGMLMNGGFEVVPPEASGWSPDAFKPADAQFIWEPEGSGRNGSRGASVTAIGLNDARWIQTIHGLVPGARYWLTGWIKGENIVPEPGRTYGANLSLFEPQVGTPGNLTGTFDWQRASLSFVAPDSGSVTVACRIGYFGNLVTGKAWFDDIAVVRHAEPRLVEPQVLPAGPFRFVLLAPRPATYAVERSGNLTSWSFIRNVQVVHPDTELFEDFAPPGPWFYRAVGD